MNYLPYTQKDIAHPSQKSDFSNVNSHPPNLPANAMKKIFCVLIVICFSAQAFAQTSFSGTYTWGADGNTNSFDYNGIDIANLTESPFTKVGINTASSSGNFRATGFALDPVIGSLTGTNDPSKYFEFSLTAASGFTLSMSNINFGVGRSGAGPRTFVWSSSIDSFATIITNYTVPANVTNNAGVLTIGDVSVTTLTNIVLDLSSASFQNLQSLSLRFYAYNSESSLGTGGLQGPLTFSGSLLNTNPVSGGSYWSADPAGGGSGTWTSGGTTWATGAGGVGAGETQSSTTLIFADQPGTVTVSGGVTVQNGLVFSNSDYVIQQSTVDLAGTSIANNSINTVSGVTTISSALTGSSGLTKSGVGTLILSGENTFSGGAVINAGTLQIASDAVLGDAANDLLVNGTLRVTNNVSLGAGRDLSGSATYDITDGTTLTLNGSINNTATTLANNGTLDLQGAARSLGALSLTAPGTINAAGAITVSTLTTSGLTEGTASINPDIVFTTGVKTLSVAAGGELALNGAISGATTIAKTGAGTLLINGSNSAQVRVGATAASPTDGGTVVLTSAASTGSGIIQLNYGTLRAASEIVATNDLSIGGRTGSAALLAGSNMEFQGKSSFFKGSSTSGELVLNVDNTTTFSGGFGTTTGNGTATGITLGGNGHMIISGDSSALTETIALTETVELTLNNAIGGGVSVGAGNTLGGSGTIGGDLSFASGAKFVFSLNTTMMVNGASVTFANFGVTDLLGVDSNTALGVYTILGGSATISTNGLRNFGAANAYALGDGKTAYFSEGSLQLNVVPEPSTYAMLGLAGLGFAGYVIRRRRR